MNKFKQFWINKKWITAKDLRPGMKFNPGGGTPRKVSVIGQSSKKGKIEVMFDNGDSASLYEDTKIEIK
jgi:translation elongation factor P/translation initiation factor 5A